MLTAANTTAQIQQQVNIISHNLANAETTGYKKREASFADLVAQQFNNHSLRDREPARISPVGIRQNVGARISQSAMISSQGAIKTTDRPLDIAFTKPNQYLKVAVQKNGRREVLFTRNGELSVLNTGNGWVLATKDGHPVLDRNDQNITLNGKVDQLQLTGPGTFEAKMDNGTTRNFSLGVIELTKPQFMEQKGQGLIGLVRDLGNVNPQSVYTDMQGPAGNRISMQQGALEASNVNIGDEMANLMTAQRSMQFQFRSITVADQMMGLVNGIR